jgi:hypothetical protein
VNSVARAAPAYLDERSNICQKKKGDGGIPHAAAYRRTSAGMRPAHQPADLLLEPTSGVG